MESLLFRPIGRMECNNRWNYEAASQPYLAAAETCGQIALDPQYVGGLANLAEMSHIWIIFAFDRHPQWDERVEVPRGSDKKIGVFATRSPRRPNPIGMSLVQLIKIENHILQIGPHDLLDQTPILDIKPYHPHADTPASEPQLGWMQHLDQNKFIIHMSEIFKKQARWIEQNGNFPIAAFCQQQLQFEPWNQRRKRVLKVDGQTGVLAYRTWRAHFTVRDEFQIQLSYIESGYSPDEILNQEDPWNDKNLHRAFRTLLSI